MVGDAHQQLLCSMTPMIMMRALHTLSSLGAFGFDKAPSIFGRKWHEAQQHVYLPQPCTTFSQLLSKESAEPHPMSLSLPNRQR